MFIPFFSFCKHSQPLVCLVAPLVRFSQHPSGYYLTALERLVLFSAVQEGIRGAQCSPEGQWGRTERDTWFPWQPDRMEPSKLCDVMFEIWKKQLCFDWMHLKLFDFMLLLSLQLCRIIHTAPFNTPTSAQQTGYRILFPSLLCCIDVLCFRHMMLRSEKIKIKNYLYFYKYDSIMTGYICRHFHVRCMLKLSPKFQAVSCVSTRGGVWCGSEGLECTTELVSLGCLFGWLCGCRNDRGL